MENTSIKKEIDKYLNNLNDKSKHTYYAIEIFKSVVNDLDDGIIDSYEIEENHFSSNSCYNIIKVMFDNLFILELNIYTFSNNQPDNVKILIRDNIHDDLYIYNLDLTYASCKNYYIDNYCEIKNNISIAIKKIISEYTTSKIDDLIHNLDKINDTIWLASDGHDYLPFSGRLRFYCLIKKIRNKNILDVDNYEIEYNINTDKFKNNIKVDIIFSNKLNLHYDSSNENIISLGESIFDLTSYSDEEIIEFISSIASN